MEDKKFMQKMPMEMQFQSTTQMEPNYLLMAEMLNNQLIMLVH